MADCQIELIRDSRGASLGCDSAQQSIVFNISVDDELTDDKWLFLSFKDDSQAIMDAYTLLPESRVIPDKQGDPILLILTDVTVRQVTNTIWQIIGTYSYNREQGLGGSGFESGAISLPYVKMNFSIDGGTRTLTKSRIIGDVWPQVTRITSPLGTLPGDPAIDKEGGIGVSETEVAGIEVPTTEMVIQVTGYFQPGAITTAYMKKVLVIKAGDIHAGSVANDLFMDFLVGEVSLVSVNNGAIVCNIQPITFTFSIIPNVESNTPDPPFDPLPAIWGHDYIEYQWFPTADTVAKKVLARHQVRILHRTKSEENYAELGLPNMSTYANGYCQYKWVSGSWQQITSTCLPGFTCALPGSPGTVEGELSLKIPCV